MNKRLKRKKRMEWLVSATRWRRIGEESEEQDILVTRIARKPPTYRLENYVGTQKTIASLVKAPKGEKGYDLVILGPEENAVILRYSTRRRAILAFSAMEPVREEEPEAVL